MDITSSRWLPVVLLAASIFNFGTFTVGDVKRFFGEEECFGEVVRNLFVRTNPDHNIRVARLDRGTGTSAVAHERRLGQESRDTNHSLAN